MAANPNFGVTVFTDDYDRANTLDLGASYDGGYTSFDEPQIVSNSVRAVTQNVLAVTSITLPTTYMFGWIQFTIANTPPSGAGDGVYAFMYMSAPPDLNGIALSARGQGGIAELRLVSFDSGIESELADGAALEFNTGDVIRLEVHPHPTGLSFQGFRNGVRDVNANGSIAHQPGRFGIGMRTALSGLGRSNLDNLSLGFYDSSGPHALRPAPFAPGLAR